MPYLSILVILKLLPPDWNNISNFLKLIVKEHRVEVKLIPALSDISIFSSLATSFLSLKIFLS